MFIASYVPGAQMAVKGGQRENNRPVPPSLGFDQNFSTICNAGGWRVTDIEAPGGHAPEGATFAGRHDCVFQGKDTQPTGTSIFNIIADLTTRPPTSNKDMQATCILQHQPQPDDPVP